MTSEIVLHPQFAQFGPATARAATLFDHWLEVYENHKHRIYSLAFWMTDSELEAEKITGNVFRRAFAIIAEPTATELDLTLIAALRERRLLGGLSLNCADAGHVLTVRRNTRRVDLERAVVQLPGTERLIFLLRDVEGYTNEWTAELMGMAPAETVRGVHQARLRLRELLAR
jgi:RNA polymerase sigma-70 factor (ECF subfamily)